MNQDQIENQPSAANGGSRPPQNRPPANQNRTPDRRPENRPADNRGPAQRDNDQRGPAQRDNDQRGPAQRDNDQRGNGQRDNDQRDNRRPDDRGQDDRNYDNRRQNDRGPANQDQERRRDDRRDPRAEPDPGYTYEGRQDHDSGQNLPANVGDNSLARNIVPTRAGTIGSMTPSTQRNFITLVNTNSAMARRGEAEAGVFYSRNLGNMKTVIAEIRGCYYRQRYQIWNEPSNTFRIFCEATAPTIDLLEGKGRPGGKCTLCDLTQWREQRIEGTEEVKNQPPPCNEHVIFELFIHDVAATAFWDLSSMDNLNSIRNTINILNDHFGWGNYVVELYASVHVNSKGEPRFTPHIRTRLDMRAFNSPDVVEGESHVITPQDLNHMAELSNEASHENPSLAPARWKEDPPPYMPAADETWHEQQEDDLPF